MAASQTQTPGQSAQRLHPALFLLSAGTGRVPGSPPVAINLRRSIDH